jgi:hypothetical protein
MYNPQNVIRRNVPPNLRLLQLMAYSGQLIGSSVSFPKNMSHNAILKLWHYQVYVANLSLSFLASNLFPFHNNIH